MKKSLLLFLFPLTVLAQDQVKLNDGNEMNVRIDKNTTESIAFERGKSGTLYYILKKEIAEIVYADGKVEKFTHPEISLAEAKANIIRLLDENALAEKTGRQIRSHFEGEFLRMIVLSGRTGEEINNGLLYDLSHVYLFDPISFRDENRAYLNLWTDLVRWPERNGKDRMDKIKLVLRVNDHEKATLLMDAFVELHKAFKKEQIRIMNENIKSR